MIILFQEKTFYNASTSPHILYLLFVLLRSHEKEKKELDALCSLFLRPCPLYFFHLLEKN